MLVGIKDKRVRTAVEGALGTPCRGLQLQEADRIRIRVRVLTDAETLKQVADAHPEWRVHRWRGNEQWSIDVLANTRLLFDYALRGHTISRMVYEDPH